MRLFGQKRVALASFPRSGNTWIRFMLEATTGEKTGSRYQDRILPRSSEGIVIKTHEIDSHRYTDAIHLIRNPFDAIDSYFYFRREIAGEDDLSWDEHVEFSVFKWYEHTAHWFQANCSLFRIRYEDLHQDTTRQLNSLLNWLGYKFSIDCIREAINKYELNKLRESHSRYGHNFFRRGKIGGGLEHFTNNQRQLVRDVLEGFLKEFGYQEPS